MKLITLSALVLVTLSACGKQEPVPPPPSAAPGGASASGAARPEKASNGEPAVITVQHVLLSFNGAGTKATRTKEEAEKLAFEVLNRAKSGEDFEKLMKELSDDSPTGGTYTLVNSGVTPDQAAGEYARSGMVPAFGDVGFRLAVGEIGLADYDPKVSPYGVHIIKRIK
jgi:hypothetical protein